MGGNRHAHCHHQSFLLACVFRSLTSLGNFLLTCASSLNPQCYLSISVGSQCMMFSVNSSWPSGCQQAKIPWHDGVFRLVWCLKSPSQISLGFYLNLGARVPKRYVHLLNPHLWRQIYLVLRSLLMQYIKMRSPWINVGYNPVTPVPLWEEKRPR